jgi:hypothetical protein
LPSDVVEEGGVDGAENCPGEPGAGTVGEAPGTSVGVEVLEDGVEDGAAGVPVAPGGGDEDATGVADGEGIAVEVGAVAVAVFFGGYVFWWHFSPPCSSIQPSRFFWA